MSAPLAVKHAPHGFDEIWNMVAPVGKLVIGENELEQLSAFQKVHYFRGSGKMRTMGFELDSLGSMRLFSQGKIRMQFFKASELVKFGASKDKEFGKACEQVIMTCIDSTSHLPTSMRAIIDATDGPVMLVVPPGYFVVQEALDSSASCGVRRSFSPRGGVLKSEFELACPASFVFRDVIVKAMKALCSEGKP